MARTNVSRQKDDRLADDVAKRVLSNMKEDDKSEDAELDEVEEVEYGDKLAETIGFDVFDYGDEKEKKGDQVLYVIRKNGEMLTSKYHPYSWQKLQEDFGAGSYHVQARSLTTKRYLKSETRPVAAPEGGVKPKMEVPEPKPTPQDQTNQFMQVFQMMSNISEKNKLEAKEISKEQGANSANMMQVFGTMIQTMSSQTNTMMMEMTKLQLMMTEKMTAANNAMFEKMDTRFEKIMEKIANTNTGKKDNGLDVMALLKLADDSQKKGFDMFDKIGKLAELKADQKIALLEEKSERSGRSKDSSLIETLIESIVPIVAKSVENSNAQINQPRGLLPQPNRPYQPQPIGHRQGNPNPPISTSDQTTAPQSQTNSTPNGRINREDNKQANVILNEFGLPSAQPQLAVVKEIVPVTKEKIEELLVPTIATSLLNLETPEQGKERIKNVLQENKISVQLFLDTFKKEDAIQIVTKYGLPKEAVQWFESVYANFTITA